MNREVEAIPEVLRRRSAYVLALAAAEGHKRLVLGAWAWGCGVFRNDPDVVAGVFADHLLGQWSGHFERVVFSVLDTSATLDTFTAFKRAFAR